MQAARVRRRARRAALYDVSRAVLGLSLRRPDARLLLSTHQPEHDRDGLRGSWPARRISSSPGVDAALEPAIGAGDFFLRHVPQTQAQPGAYFGYLPGDRTPIHNANMLVAALLARLARETGREQFARAAAAAVDYTVSRQRPDGSWPYGEQPGLSWIDGFHTGYVLDCLLTCIEMEIGGDAAEQAWRRGLHYYVARIDRARRYSALHARPPLSDRRPVRRPGDPDSLRAAAREPGLAERRWAVFDFAQRRLTRRDERSSSSVSDIGSTGQRIHAGFRRRCSRR